MAEELNNKVLKDDDEPQKKVKGDISMERENGTALLGPQKVFPKIKPPFSHRLKKKEDEEKCYKFLLLSLFLSIYHLLKIY